MLDTFHDERDGYMFQTNPAGAKLDAQFINEGRREWLFDGRQRLGDLSLADYPIRLLGQKLLCDSILAGAG